MAVQLEGDGSGIRISRAHARKDPFEVTIAGVNGNETGCAAVGVHQEPPTVKTRVSVVGGDGKATRVLLSEE